MPNLSTSKSYSQRLIDALIWDCENANQEHSFASVDAYLEAKERIRNTSDVNALISIGLNEYAWDMEYVGTIRWS